MGGKLKGHVAFTNIPCPVCGAEIGKQCHMRPGVFYLVHRERRLSAPAVVKGSQLEIMSSTTRQPKVKRERMTHKPLPAVISAQCRNGKHCRCFKLSYPCDCHPRVK